MSKNRQKSAGAQPATITITIREFTQAVPVLVRMFSEARPLDVRTTYRLAQLRRALSVHDALDAPHNVVREQLVTTHVVHDEQGRPATAGNDYVFKSAEDRAAFLAGIETIMNEKLEVAGARLTLDDLAGLSLPTPLSVTEMDAIAWLVAEPAPAG